MLTLLLVLLLILLVFMAISRRAPLFRRPTEGRRTHRRRAARVRDVAPARERRRAVRYADAIVMLKSGREVTRRSWLPRVWEGEDLSLEDKRATDWTIIVRDASGAILDGWPDEEVDDGRTTRPR